MYCVNCGEALPKGVVVNACPACGADLRDLNGSNGESEGTYYKGVIKAYLDSFLLKTKGGINIKEYWLASILHYIVIFATFYTLALITSFIYSITYDPVIEDITLTFLFFLIDVEPIFYVLVSIPIATLAIRRMHDVGKSGWYSFIPIYSLILTLTPSLERNNPYR